MKIDCDEAADCGPLAVCCADLFDGSDLAFSATCRDNCIGPNNRVQLCSSSAECTSGECLVRTCESGALILACTSTLGCP
jgi:hypothetical protein